MTHDAEVADTRPVFVIPVFPAEVPPALLALPDYAEVLYVSARAAGLSNSGAGKAGCLVESIRQAIERQGKGRFWLHEAAQIIADARGFDARRLFLRMKEAFRLGDLCVRDPATGTPRIPGEVELSFHNAFVTPADIDRWLTKVDADYRFPVVPQTTCASAKPASNTSLAPAPSGSAVALPEPVAPSAEAVPVQQWTVKKPGRFQGYGHPLHELLRRAYAAGNARPPTAQCVLDAWSSSKPHVVVRVMPNSFEYFNGAGVIKEADRDAIRKAIGRMVGRTTSGR